MEIFKKGNNKFLRVGDNVVPFDDFDEMGNPIINPCIEKTKKNGKQHILIKIPTLKVRIKNNK